ncbi:MAG: alpha/beta hydrolase [Actinomycetia bacterium]|nr:alpha/beta hydrolase [Actinomycetes bacterium]
MTQTHELATPEAMLVYDVHGPLPPVGGRPPLMMVAAPMDASGFASLASHFEDRTVVTYDPRGTGRSVRRDGDASYTADRNATDIHRIIEALDAGPVEMFASSGGAGSALCLAVVHPDDVSTLVAHEPPMLAMLPDAERAFAAERAVQETYAERGWGHGMAAFLDMSSWSGEFTDAFTAREAPDPSAFGLPADDDGSRDDPLLSGASNSITSCRTDFDALADVSTRIVIAVGVESRSQITGRTSEAVAQALGRQVVEFPGDHGGFLGGEFGQAGDPEAFAATLRRVLGRSD